MIVNQLLPAVHFGDAIGDEARFIRRWLLAAGHEARIFCMQTDPRVAGEVESWRRFQEYDRTGSITVLHYALPSPLTGVLLQSKGKKAIIYHNITPPEFFIGYGKELMHIAREGRRQLAQLAGCVDLAMGDSEYNCQELAALRFTAPKVLPICYDFNRLEQPANPVLMRMFDDDFTNIIFVGRLAPNKRYEDLLRVFCCYKRYIRQRSRLFLVGNYRGFMKYYDQLQHMSGALGLREVYFTGHVELNEMVAYYRLAHVFLSLSEHEGFCVPLLECMHLGVPIVAFEAGAIAGTLDGSGMLVRTKDPLLLAELCHECYENHELRQRLVTRQQLVKSKYATETIRQALFGYLRELEPRL